MPKSLVVKTAKSYGAVAEFRPDREKLSHEIVIDAPDGKVWSASGLHQLVMCGDNGTPWENLYEDAVERMSYGVEVCDDTECDICLEALQSIAP